MTAPLSQTWANDLAGGTPLSAARMTAIVTAVNAGISAADAAQATATAAVPTSTKGAVNGVASLDAGGLVPAAQLPVQLGPVTVKALSADQTNSDTTPTDVTGLDLAAGVGTFMFTYRIRYQSASVANGVRFDVNHSGTVTSLLWNQYWVNNLATVTAAPDQDSVLASGSAVGAFASRAKGTAGRGTTLSVDTADADMLMVIEGLMVVTVAGNLQLWHGSEVVAATTVKAGSSLMLVKTT